jgi:hypothetical protein
MGRKPTLVFEGSPNWYCHCTVNRHRFRVSLGTDDRKTAEIRSKVVLAMASGRALPPRLARAFSLSLHFATSAEEISRLTWGDLASLLKQHARAAPSRDNNSAE